jgi:hypothetical protein
MNHLHHLRIHVQADRIDGYAICGPPHAKDSAACEPGAVIDTWSVRAPASGKSGAGTKAAGSGP